MNELNLKPNHRKDFRQRVFIFLSILFILFIIIVFRTGQIQIIHGKSLEKIALTYQQKPYHAEPLRGTIFDRNGYPLVDAKPAFKLTLIPQVYDQDPEGTKKLWLLAKILKKTSPNTKKTDQELIQQTYDLFQQRINKAKEKIKKLEQNENEAVVTLSRDATLEQITWIKEQHNMNYFPWLRDTMVAKRTYPLGRNLAHLLGYTGMISDTEWETILKENKHKKNGRYVYRFDSEKGVRGIEAKLDRWLRGFYGEKYRLLDSRGRSIIQEIEEKTKRPIPGYDVQLTIDHSLQETVYRALGDRIGVVVVSRPSTGEILAMVSSPCFDPNDFNMKYETYLNDPDKPLVNRAIQTLIPPASIFKIVVAAAALESKKWQRNNHFTCSGIYYLGSHPFACMGHHGSLHLKDAIKKSCNIYFYQLGLTIGWETIFNYAQTFGLGQPTGFDVGSEESGILPNEEWKKQKFNEKWYAGDTVVACIGQGYLLFTPLQIHNIVSLIANNGVLQKPFIIDKIIDPETKQVVAQTDPTQRIHQSDYPLSESTVHFLQDAMREVTDTGGTGYWYAGRSCEVPIAGKTGTGQSFEGEPHAWFTSYAPYNAKDPKEIIAITVFLEHGGAGGANAAPIAAAIYKSYFEQKNHPSYYCQMDQGSLIMIPYYEKKTLKESFEDLQLEYIPTVEEQTEMEDTQTREIELVSERVQQRQIEQIYREYQDLIEMEDQLTEEMNQELEKSPRIVSDASSPSESVLEETQAKGNLPVIIPPVPTEKEVKKGFTSDKPIVDASKSISSSSVSTTTKSSPLKSKEREKEAIQQKKNQLKKNYQHIVENQKGEQAKSSDRINKKDSSTESAPHKEDSKKGSDSAKEETKPAKGAGTAKEVADPVGAKTDKRMWDVNIDSWKSFILIQSDKNKSGKYKDRTEEIQKDIEKKKEKNKTIQEQIQHHEIQVNVDEIRSQNELLKVQEERSKAIREEKEQQAKEKADKEKAERSSKDSSEKKDPSQEAKSGSSNGDTSDQDH